jgi:hypothetical protein
MATPTVEQYITYAEVFGAAPTRADVEDFVRGTSLDDWLQTVGKLSRDLFDPRVPNKAVDRLLASGLPGDARERAEKLIDVGRPLAFDTRLGTLARVAFCHAERRPADAFGGGQAGAERMVRALLAVADIFDPGDLFSGSDAERRDQFSSLMLRRLSAKTRAALVPAFVRYWRLFIDLPAQDPSLLVAGENPDEKLRTITGMGIRRYLALCFGVYTRWMTWTLERNPAWAIDQTYWSKTTISEDEFLAGIGTLAASPDEFQKEFEADAAAGFETIDDLRPIALHPLCEITSGKVLPLDAEALGPRLLGDGLFWRLKPLPSASEAEKSAYNATIGHLVEAHCLELAKSVYPEQTGKPELFGEVAYGGELGPDLVVIEDGSCVFVEVSAERVNVRDTLFRGSLGAYENDIEAIVVDRVRRQLDRKISDARAGDLRFGTNPPSNLGTIHPVLCLIDGFPLAPTLRERVDAALAQAGLLQHEDVGRLSIISVEEFEALMGEVERGASLSGLLAAWANDQEMSRWTVRDFLLARRGGLALASSIREHWKLIKPQLGQELFGANFTGAPEL